MTLTIVRKETPTYSQKMTKEEFDHRLKQLGINYREAKDKLEEEFALSNNPYSIGDHFRDHIGLIRVDSINVSYDHAGNPSCVYEGLEIKRDGSPKKSGAIRKAWQCNEVKKITHTREGAGRRWKQIFLLMN